MKESIPVEIQVTEIHVTRLFYISKNRDDVLRRRGARANI